MWKKHKRIVQEKSISKKGAHWKYDEVETSYIQKSAYYQEMKGFRADLIAIVNDWWQAPSGTSDY